MKNIFKPFLIGLLLIGVASSCEDSTNAIDVLYDNVDNSGAFVRTLEFPKQLVNLTDPTKNFIAANIEVQEGNGSFDPDFKEVRIYFSTYNDQDQLEPTLDTQGNPFGEQAILTLPSSEFTPSVVNRLPSTTFNIPVQNIVDALPDAVFTFPTFIYVRLELELTDGRIFTDTNVGPTVVSGAYFRSPFFYNIIFLNN